MESDSQQVTEFKSKDKDATERFKEQNTRRNRQKSEEQKKRNAASSKAYRERLRRFKDERLLTRTRIPRTDEQKQKSAARSKAYRERKKRLMEQGVLKKTHRSDEQKRKAAAQTKAYRHRLKLKKKYLAPESLSNDHVGCSANTNLRARNLKSLKTQPQSFIKEEPPSTSSTSIRLYPEKNEPLSESSMDINETVIIKQEEEEDEIQNEYENSQENVSSFIDNPIVKEEKKDQKNSNDEEYFNDVNKLNIKHELRSEEDDEKKTRISINTEFKDNQKVDKSIQVNMTTKTRSVSIQTSSILCECTYFEVNKKSKST